MDRAVLEERLAKANGAVADTIDVVMRQRSLVQRLERQGPPGMLLEAKALLIRFEELMGLVIADRNLIGQELDELAKR